MTLQWENRTAFNVVMTSRLTTMTWETLLIERSSQNILQTAKLAITSDYEARTHARTHAHATNDRLAFNPDDATAALQQEASHKSL